MSSTFKKVLLFQASFVLIACIAIEIVLRIIGYAPGDLRPNWLWFQPVDTLYTIHDFYVNEKGIQVADKAYWAEHDTIYINSDGFRNKEFNAIDTARKKVLIIGDSFAWGMSASPVQDSSFTDLLKQISNYEVINTGIPATDPAQYAEIGKHYIPRVKPDYVFVFFFTGNDLMARERSIVPNVPLEYWTNAGAVSADIDGRHFANAQDAYNYLVNEKYYLKQPKQWYEKVIAKSALLSRLYAGKFRIEEKLAFERKVKHTEVSRKYLSSIVNLGKQYNVPVKLVIVPELKNADMSKEDYYKKYSDLLTNNTIDTCWLYPPTKAAYYRPYPDAHLNNEGHRQYALYLKSVLAAHFKQ